MGVFRDGQRIVPPVFAHLYVACAKVSRHLRAIAHCFEDPALALCRKQIRACCPLEEGLYTDCIGNRYHEICAHAHAYAPCIAATVHRDPLLRYENGMTWGSIWL